MVVDEGETEIADPEGPDVPDTGCWMMVRSRAAILSRIKSIIDRADALGRE